MENNGASARDHRSPRKMGNSYKIVKRIVERMRTLVILSLTTYFSEMLISNFVEDAGHAFRLEMTAVL